MLVYSLLIHQVCFHKLMLEPLGILNHLATNLILQILKCANIGKVPNFVLMICEIEKHEFGEFTVRENVYQKYTRSTKTLHL